MIGSGNPRSAGLEARRQELELSTFELWVRCISIGGDLTLTRLRSLLTDGQPPVAGEDAVIEQALDEAAMDQGPT